MTELLAVPAERIQVVPLGVNVEHYAAPPRQAGVLLRYPYTLASARWSSSRC